jgi:hypothetical protein
MPDNSSFIAATAAAAVLIGVWAMRRTPAAPRAYWLIPGIGVLGIVDEIGLGAGLFGFGRLEVGEVTVKGIDDLFAAGVHLATDTLGLTTLDLIAAGGAVLALVAFYLARRGRAARIAAWLRDHPPGILLAAVIGIIVLANVLEFVDEPSGVAFISEMLELAGFGVLVLAALQIPRPDPSLQGWRPRMAAWFASVPNRSSAS